MTQDDYQRGYTDGAFWAVMQLLEMKWDKGDVTEYINPLLAAAKMLQDNCKKRNDCINCPFLGSGAIKGFSECRLGYRQPEHWRLEDDKQQP